MLEPSRDAYSRQAQALGEEAQQRVAAASVLVVGLGGCGAEVAKNLVLSGVRCVCLHDDEAATPDDMTSQVSQVSCALSRPSPHASERPSSC